MMNKILIIDDEPQIRKFLKMTLKVHGYLVFEAVDARNATDILIRENPDLVVLDLGLPDIDGQIWLKNLREYSETPVIVLSARSNSAQIVLALDNGANDYVIKPFDMPEFLARLRQILRQKVLLNGLEIIKEQSFVFGNMLVDLALHEVKINDGIITLSKKEFELLRILAGNSGRLIAQAQILKHIWGEHLADEVQYLRVYIGQLRKKLATCNKQPIIKTESGIGYRFVEKDIDT